MEYNPAPVGKVDLGTLFTPVVTIYLIAAGLLSLICNTESASHLVLSADNIQSLKIWTLLTYTFFHCGFLQYGINVVIFLLIGHYVEKEMGKAPFCLFLAVVSILSGLAWVIVSAAIGHPEAIMLGANCLCYAMIIAYGFIRRKSLMMMPGTTVKMNVMQVMIICLVISALLQINYPLFLVMFSGAIWGYLYMLMWKKFHNKRVGYVKPKEQKKQYNGFIDID